MDVAEAEAAARHAMQIALEAGLQNVVLEADNQKLIIQYVKAKRTDKNRFSSIVRDILHLATCFSCFDGSHVSRNCNTVARTLAKISSSFDIMRVWIEEISPEAQSHVLCDILSMNE